MWCCLREAFDRDPVVGDEDTLSEMLQQLLRENGVAGSGSGSGKAADAVLSEAALKRLCETAAAVSVMTLSVTGSFLSQVCICIH
jgi:hypothetical protein